MSKSNDRIERSIENESCSTTWVDPKTVVETYPNPKNSPLGHQKFKINHNIKTESKVTIEKYIENEIFSIKWVEPKTVFESYQNP